MTLGALRTGCGRFTFCDDFVRNDTTAPSIGTPLSGAAYDLRGVGGSIAAQSGSISGNTFTSDASRSAVYAIQTSATPISEIGGIFGWTATAGGGAVAAPVFLISINPGGASLINTLPLHAVVNQTSLQIGYFTSGSFTVVKTVTFPTALSSGVDYFADFVIDGNLIRYTVAGYSGIVFQPTLAQQASNLKYPGWELFYNSTTPPANPYFKATWYSTAPSGSAQLVDLATAYWKLDTTAWTDATGQGNTLSGVNTPTSVAGIIKNGVGLVRASSQKLTISSNASLQMSGRDWSIGAWINPTGTPSGATYYPVFSKAGSASTIEYIGFVDGSNDKFTCLGSADGTLGSQVVSTVSTLITAGNWYYVECTYDSIAKTLSAYVNGTKGNSPTLTATFNGTSAFEIGYSGTLNGVHAGSYWDGTIDEVNVFSSAPGQGAALRTPRHSVLYNDGQAFSYPF